MSVRIKSFANYNICVFKFKFKLRIYEKLIKRVKLECDTSVPLNAVYFKIYNGCLFEKQERFIKN